MSLARKLLGILIVLSGVIFSAGQAAHAIDSPHFCRVRTAQAAFRATDAASGQATRAGVLLLAEPARVAPSTVVYARLANFGAHVVGYGREFQIQQLGNEGWELDPFSPDGPWVKVRGIIRPGLAGRCYRFSVPLDEAPGRHRFVTGIEIGLNHRHSVRTARFAVLQP